MTSLPPLFDLCGKTALITGSSRGLGLVMARALGLAGARVVLNGRNAETLNRAAADLRENGIDCQPSLFDICEEAEIRTAVSEIEKQTGPVSILVNNAGVNIRKPLENFSADDWDRLMDINLKGAFLVSREVAPGMIGRKSGKIVNICSMQSELGRPTITPYAASKGGLKMLTRGMAVEWGRHNIQVNGIGPGYFRTELTRPLWEDPEFDRWLCNRTPAHRWGDPEELTGPLLFLASRASDYVNGHILYVDGGLLAAI